MTNDEIQRSILWNSLAGLGVQVKLNLKMNTDEVEKQLKQFKENWCPYNAKKDSHNNRWGLPVTSHSGDVMDNYHLNSFGYMQKYHNLDMKEQDFTTPTAVYYNIPEIKKLVDIFNPDIGRVHLLRIDKGGFFPPHRDFSEISPEYFRLITVFGKCNPENYAQIFDGKLYYPQSGYTYFTNTKLSHSVFSFTDSVYALILTVRLTKKTHDIIIDHLMEH